MAIQQTIGDKGEEIAQIYLLKKGYKIVATNWHFGHNELDIIANDGEQLVIVEVKSRTGHSYEHPSEAVSNQKIKRIVDAAEGYILKHNLNVETRFDVITVIFTADTYELEHFEDAFYPTM